MPTKERGDTLEVKLKDSMMNYYYKGQALTNNKKQIRKLIEDLKAKGVEFKSGWFD